MSLRGSLAPDERSTNDHATQAPEGDESGEMEKDAMTENPAPTDKGSPFIPMVVDITPAPVCADCGHRAYQHGIERVNSIPTGWCYACASVVPRSVVERDGESAYEHCEHPFTPAPAEAADVRAAERDAVVEAAVALVESGAIIAPKLAPYAALAQAVAALDSSRVREEG